jgi:hypothetical protein
MAERYTTTLAASPPGAPLIVPEVMEVFDFRENT